MLKQLISGFGFNALWFLFNLLFLLWVLLRVNVSLRKENSNVKGYILLFVLTFIAIFLLFGFQKIGFMFLVLIITIFLVLYFFKFVPRSQDKISDKIVLWLIFFISISVLIVNFFILSGHNRKEIYLIAKQYVCPLDAGKKDVVIGRGTKSDIAVLDRFVDDKHVLLTIREKVDGGGDKPLQVIVKNISNRRKVFVNNENLNSVVLKKGDRVTVKGKTWEFLGDAFYLPFYYSFKMRNVGTQHIKTFRVFLYSSLNFKNAANFVFQPPSLWIFSYTFIFSLFFVLFLLSCFLYVFLGVEKWKLPFWLFLFVSFIVVFVVPLIFPGKLELSYRRMNSTKKNLVKINGVPLFDLEKQVDPDFDLSIGYTDYNVKVQDNKGKLCVYLTPKEDEKMQLTFKNVSENGFLLSIIPNFNFNFYPNNVNLLKFPKFFKKKIISSQGKVEIQGSKGEEFDGKVSIFQKNSFFTDAFLIFLFLYFLVFLMINLFSNTFGNETVIITMFFFFLSGIGLCLKGGFLLYLPNYQDFFSSFYYKGLLLSILVFILFLIYLFLEKKKKFDVYKSLSSQIVDYANSKVLDTNIKFLKWIRTGFKYFLQSFLDISSVLWIDMIFLLVILTIILQWFLGSEVGISIGNTSIQLFELSKVLLVLYLVDWTVKESLKPEISRNKLRLYILIMIPLLLLIVTVHDFSPSVIIAMLLFFHSLIAFSLEFTVQIFLYILFFVLYVLQMFLPGNLILIFLFVTFVLLLSTIYFYYREHDKSIFITNLIFFFLLLLMLPCLHKTLLIYHLLGKTNIARITVLLDPWHNVNFSEHFLRSSYFLSNVSGSSNFLGQLQNAFLNALYVPRIKDDFVFALFAKSYGLFGVFNFLVTILLFFFFIIFHAFSIEENEYNDLKKFRFYGLILLTILLLIQIVVPIFSVLGLFPVMGQPLPFLAFANSHLVLFCSVIFGMISVLINRWKNEE